MSARDKPGRKQWHARYLLRCFNLFRDHEPVKRLVRHLADDPWFVRAIFHGTDAVSMSEQFVWPLVMQSLIALRGNLRWPPPPMNDDSIERITGVPQFGRALDATGICPRDRDGLFDLTPLDELLPWPVKGWDRDRHQWRIRWRKMQLRKLGLTDHDGSTLAAPKGHWRTKREDIGNDT